MTSLVEKADALAKLDPDTAKKAGISYGKMVSGMQIEIINSGLKQADAIELIRRVMDKGNCSSGTMCTTLG